MPADEGERYYYADGKKVGLTTSRRFLAVKAPDEDDGRGGAMAFGVATESAQVLELPEYDLAVIALSDVGGVSAPEERRFDAVRSAVEAAPDVASGPEVYETTEPGPEALIAIAEVVVKFKEDVPEDARTRLLAKHKASIKQEDYPEPGADLLELPADKDPVTVANDLHESDLVEFAEPNFVHLTPRPEEREFANGRTMTIEDAPMTREGLDTEDGAPLGGADTVAAAPAAPPTDPGYASQWGLKKIMAPGAWDISMGSTGISVAIIDEGCDLGHEDLMYKTPGYDAYQGDNDPSPLPADGHGTSCAGVANAKANNGKGGAGVAPNCRVLPVRIAKGVGGGFWDTTSAKVADGIRKAVERGADVLSNSYGVGPSTLVTNAFMYAQTSGRGGRGCPIAAATGNGDMLGVIYPARLSPTIRGFLAVGASNEWDQRKSKTSLDGETWWGSNFGPEVDVVAPGVHIYTTDITGAAGYGGGNYIPAFNGTSSATPHVAGRDGAHPVGRPWAPLLGGRGHHQAHRRRHRARRPGPADRLRTDQCAAGARGGVAYLVLDHDRARVPRHRQGVLHARQRAHVQSRDQHGAARRADADVAQPVVDERDRPHGVPPERGQRAPPADEPGCPPEPDPAQGERQPVVLELPLGAELELHVLAAVRAGVPARRDGGGRVAGACRQVSERSRQRQLADTPRGNARGSENADGRRDPGRERPWRSAHDRPSDPRDQDRHPLAVISDAGGGGRPPLPAALTFG